MPYFMKVIETDGLAQAQSLVNLLPVHRISMLIASFRNFAFAQRLFVNFLPQCVQEFTFKDHVFHMRKTVHSRKVYALLVDYQV